ncbi:MAG: hypothetical protein ACE148_11470 [Vicinamibacterales bacterium]
MLNAFLSAVVALSVSAGLLAELQWRSVGPAIMGGRVDDLAVVQGNPDAIYMATASGGLWKTTNGGTTWAPVFDNYGTTSIGAVAVAPSNPDIVWVGTGEANNRQSSSWGNGVYKSTDAGATWQLMGLADSRHVGRIVIDPKNPDIVYVAAMGRLWGPNKERGLFKTADGGKTWVNTKFIDEDTGFVDVAMDPSDNRVLYAAAYQRRRTAFGFNGGGPGSGLYKTTDAGKTWTRLTSGLPSGSIGRIGIDIYRKDPSIVYVTVEHREGGLFRSEDRGKSWKKVNSLNPRPMYFSKVRIDPRDDRRIYLLGVSLYVSDDGGKTFRSDGARNLHVDHHAMWIDPENSNVIFIGNDGGFGVSRDGAKTWMRMNNVPLGQVYVVGFDMDDPFRLYAGLQDNGVWGGPSATRNRVGPLNDDWYQVGGGDGMFVTPDPTDSRVVYLEMNNGRILRFDRVSGESKAIRPVDAGGGGGPGGGQEAQAGPPADRFNWTTPLVISPHNPRTVYLAGNRLWRSLDRGEHWTAISPDLTKQIDRDKLPIMSVTGEAMLSRNDGVSSYGNATSMAESPVTPGLFLVGTDDGNVQMSKDGGATWTDLTPRFPGLPDRAWVSRVLPSRFDARGMLVAFDHHRSDDLKPYIYRSDDGGESWRLTVQGLPESPVRTIQEGLRNPDLLFAGTEAGLWISLDKGASWSKLKNGLPDVPVFDIQIHPKTRELVLGTHGRGIYLMNIASLEEMRPELLAAPAHLFQPVPATTFNVLEHRDFLAQGTYVGANPPRGAVIDYNLSQKVERARVIIEDRDGRTVVDLPASGEPGLHRLVWDLRYAEPPQPPRTRSTEGVDPSDPRPAESTLARIPGDYGGGGDPTGGEAGAAPEPQRGPVVMPGDYIVKLVAGNLTVRTLLRVNGDPRIEIDEEDRQARFAVLMKVYEAQKKANPAATAANSLAAQMTVLTRELGKLKDASKAAKDAAEEAAKKVRDAQGRLTRPLGRAGSVGREVAGSTSRPTELQMRTLQAALEQLEPAVVEFDDLAAKLVPELNRRLDEEKVPASVPRLKVIGS